MLGTVSDHLQELLLVRSCAPSGSAIFQSGRAVERTLGSLRTTLLDNELVEPKLLRGTLQHTFLHAAFRDEAEDVDLLRLADTMSTVHCLQVGLGVPVTVVQNNHIGTRQVDTESTSAGRQQEDELLAVRLVVLVDGDDTVLMSGAAIDAAVLCRVSRSAPFIRYVRQPHSLY